MAGKGQELDPIVLWELTDFECRLQSGPQSAQRQKLYLIAARAITAPIF